MYNPTKNLMDGVRRAFVLQLFPWDDYFPRMGETEVLAGRGKVMAAKSFFIREAPFGGACAVLGGITDCLRTMQELNFRDPYFIQGMRDMGYCETFIEYLKEAGHLKLAMLAPQEGTVFFPNEPIITVFGPLPHIRLAEGIITQAINFATLSLTKWTRLVRTVRPGRVMEFARRRAQNDMKTSFYAALAGCYSSSNSEIRRFFDIPIQGTMGHEWVQSFGDVAEAFDVWLTHQPGRAFGLIDTLQTMKVDFPLWLDAVYKHRDAIKAANAPVWGWRNDSGDLAELSIKQYLAFFKHPLSKDEWFAERMRIILTNDLDEYTAELILNQIRNHAQPAGIDASDIVSRIIWAAGTKPGTCSDQPSLGGVCKLMATEDILGNMVACIKLAFDTHGLPGIKTSIPGANASALIVDKDTGEIFDVLIYPWDRYKIDENGQFVRINGTKGQDGKITVCHPNNANATMTIASYRAIPQQRYIPDVFSAMEETSVDTIEDVVRRVHEGLDRLPFTSQKLGGAHPVRVSLTPELYKLREQMIQLGVLREDKLTTPTAWQKRT